MSQCGVVIALGAAQLIDIHTAPPGESFQFEAVAPGCTEAQIRIPGMA